MPLPTPSSNPTARQDFTPRKAVILVGAGGTGAKCVAEVARALEAVGQKFGEAIGENGAIVNAVVVDGDEKTWLEADDNPDAALLNRSGAKKLYLYTREQGSEIRRRKLTDVMTPGLHSEHDPAGCNADPRTARIRYLIQREGAETESNPRTLFKGLALDLINLNGGETLGEVLEIVYVGGMHGGTGPVLLDVAADANAIMRDILGRGASSRAIRTFSYLMTSESADLDPSMGRNPVQILKRRRNCAATVMRVDESTVTGQVVLADGVTVIQGVPFEYSHFINGRSGEVAASEHYAPIMMVARAIVARILQRGGVASSESNVNTNILEPSLNLEKLPSNWIAMGLAELLSNPSRNLLHYKKEHIALAEATGVDAVDSAEKDRRLAQVQLSEILKRALDAVASELPEIEESEFGAVDKAKFNVTRLESEFKGSMPSFRTAVQRSIQEELRKSWSAVATANTELRAGKKIGTLVALSQDLSQQVQILIDQLANEQIPAFQVEVISHGDLMTQAVDSLKGIEYSSWNIFRKGEQEQAIRSAISTIVAAAERFARSTAKLIAAQALLQLFQKENGFQAAVASLRANVLQLTQNIQQVRTSIEPERTIKSPFDLPIEIQTPAFAGAGNGLDPKDYSVESLTQMLDGVRLEREGDLRSYLRDPNIQAALARRAAPLVIAPAKADHAGKEFFKEVTVPVSQGDGFRVASDGTIKNADQALGIDPSYTVKATDSDGPIIMQERLYGLTVFDCAYLQGVIRELILDAVKDSEKVDPHFSHKGQMESLLPVYAAALAEYDLQRDGAKGETVEMALSKYGTSVKIYKTEAELAQEARVAAARQVKKK